MGLCIFQNDFLSIPDYSNWLAPHKDKDKAYCKLCQDFSIGSQGIVACYLKHVVFYILNLKFCNLGSAKFLRYVEGVGTLHRQIEGTCTSYLMHRRLVLILKF